MIASFRAAQIWFQRVNITLIHKLTYFHGGLKVKVEHDQLAPKKALDYFHIQELFSLFLSTKANYPPLSVIIQLKYWMKCPLEHFIVSG